MIVLHPKHKLGYFHEAGWPQEWLDTAEELVRERYRTMYEGVLVEDDVDVPNECSEDDDDVCAHFHFIPLLSTHPALHVTRLIYLRLLHLCHWTVVPLRTSSSGICLRSVRMLWMPWNGGMRGVKLILTSLEWR